MENEIVDKEERSCQCSASGDTACESAACESAASGDAACESAACESAASGDAACESAACESVPCEGITSEDAAFKAPVYKNVLNNVIMPWIKKYSHPAGIVICSLLLVFCITLPTLLIKGLHNEIKEQEKIITSQGNMINDLIDKFDKNSEAIIKLEDQIKNNGIEKADYSSLTDQISVLNKKAFANDLGHFISGGIVTEHFVIDRAIFWLDDDRLKGIMDIIPQPNYEKNYAGQGRYKVSNEELGNELTQLVKRVENMYAIFSGKYEWAPGFSKSFFNITTSNYNVAVFENNEITIQSK